MTTPTSQLFAGSRLTALGIRGSAPLAAYKSSSQTASGSTLGNDSALVLALQASAVYRFALVFGYTGGTLGSSDLKFGWSLPSGASMGYSVYGNTTAGAATAAPWYTDSSSPAALGSNGSTPISAVMAGTVAVSASAGNLQFQFARNASSGTAPTVLAGAALLAWQVQ